MSDFIMEKVFPVVMLLLIAVGFCLIGMVIYLASRDDPRIGALCPPGLAMFKIEQTVLCAVPPIRVPQP